MPHPAINFILDTFQRRGSESYADEPVTQLQHALQCAQLARENQASDSLVLASLLHDLGHIMADSALPASLEEDLHDAHEARAYDWLLNHFGAAVADPVHLHVAAKRYLCTTDPEYVKLLSPTSYKSYLDQGGPMSEEEIQAFEAEPHFEAALTLRRWDDQAKAADLQTPGLESYVPLMEALMQ